MSERSHAERRKGAWVPAWVTGALAASAAAAIGFGVMLAIDVEDTEPSESPLLLSVARQLLAGPWGLYGPFGGRNPLVLIHAPLYYHLAALLAWPLARAGLDPVMAARFVGRSLSMLGLVVSMAAAFRLARLDGVPARPGWWAAFLIAAVPVVGIMPFTVRPDMLGVALQTTGVLLVLGALRSKQPRGAALTAAFAAFGLAICVKQHFVVGPVISTCLLLVEWQRGRVAFWMIARALLLTLAIVLAVYGTEELATGGRMSQAVFLAAMNTGRTHPADWKRTGIVLSAIIGRSTDLIALLAAAGLARVGARPGVLRRAFGVIGAGSVLFLLVMAVLQTRFVAPWIGISSLAATLACLLLVIPACTLIDRQTLVGGRLDSILWVFLAAELIVVFVLCRASTGAWVNYGIQAVVFACILTARALARVCDGVLKTQQLLPILFATCVVVVGVFQDVYWAAHRRRYNWLAVTRVKEELRRPSDEFFFAGRPGANRLHGRLDLVYDDWLYPVFESMRLAEPRSSWLRIALTSGTVRFVVNNSGSPEIDGLGQTLAQLGYVSRFQVGPYFVWERIAASHGGVQAE